MKITQQGSVNCVGYDKLYASDTVILLAIETDEKYASIFSECYGPNGIEIYLQTEEDSLSDDFDPSNITVVLLDDISHKNWSIWGSRTEKHTVQITLINYGVLFQHER